MKKYTLISVLTVLLACLGQLGTAKAQGSFAFHPIISEGLVVSEEIELQYPHVKILKLEFDIAKEENITYIDLEKEIPYVFTCFTDENIKEISLQIGTMKDNKFTELVSKSSINGRVNIRFQPENADKYTIKVMVNKFTTSEEIGFFGLVLCNIGNRK